MGKKIDKEIVKGKRCRIDNGETGLPPGYYIRMAGGSDVVLKTWTLIIIALGLTGTMGYLLFYWIIPELCKKC